MRKTKYWIGVVLLWSIYPLLSVSRVEALPLQETMSFSLWKADYRHSLGLFQIVFADGVIDKGTTARFVAFLKLNSLQSGGIVYLNSPGGNLSEGMALGEAIRKVGFDTNIGHRGPVEEQPKNIDPRIAALIREKESGPRPKIEAGACMSACSLAYLGGVHRFLDSNSVYGVHRFSWDKHDDYDADVAQVVSSTVVNYIVKMGVDSGLFERMTQAGPSEIRILNMNDLEILKVVTGSKLKEEWELKMLPGVIYLVGTLVDVRGTSKMVFMCDHKTKILSSYAFIPMPTDQDAITVANGYVDAGYFVDGDIKQLNTSGRHVLVYADKKYVDALWVVQPQDVTAITSAKTDTGFALLAPTPGLFSGMRIGFGFDGSGREMIQSYAMNCWQ